MGCGRRGHLACCWRRPGSCCRKQDAADHGRPRRRATQNRSKIKNQSDIEKKRLTRAADQVVNRQTRVAWPPAEIMEIDLSEVGAAEACWRLGFGLV
jgi:hypothetical protein